MAVTRNRETRYSIDLSRTFGVWRVAVPTGKALRIDAQPEFGTWANHTLTVKIGPGWTPRDFASAKTIAAGGGIVQCSVDDLRGVSELIIELAGAADSGAFATLIVTIEEEDGR
jgi:hypothetical protein